MQRGRDLAMLTCKCNALHRRDVMCGGGAAMFGVIVATLMGSSKPVKAEAISGSVPELDSVAVRVVVDSYQFAVAPSRKLADVDIQHFGWGVSGNKPPGKTLISEFGLSMHSCSVTVTTIILAASPVFCEQPTVN